MAGGEERTVREVKPWNIPGLIRVAGILDACGRDMAARYGLRHWDNPRWKTLAVCAVSVLRHRVYLTRDGSGDAATFQTDRQGSLMHLSKLATLPAAAGRGLGSFCLTYAENLARAAGCAGIVLEVYDKSEHAIKFYLHRGFRTVGTVKTLRYTELRMEKTLAPL